jgi:hypothetical protein
VDSVEIDFRVSKKTVRQRKGTVDDVALYRQGTGWSRLPTQFKGETPRFYRFTAASPGLSVFTIALERAKISIEDVTLSGTSFTLGDLLVITATFRNSGRATGNATAELHIDEQTLATRQLRLDEGEKEEVRFEQRFDNAGSYELSVNGVGTQTVQVADQNATREEEKQQPSEQRDIPWEIIVTVLLAVAVGGSAYLFRERIIAAYQTVKSSVRGGGAGDREREVLRQRVKRILQRIHDTDDLRRPNTLLHQLEMADRLVEEGKYEEADERLAAIEQQLEQA